MTSDSDDDWETLADREEEVVVLNKSVDLIEDDVEINVPKPVILKSEPNLNLLNKNLDYKLYENSNNLSESLFSQDIDFDLKKKMFLGKIISNPNSKLFIEEKKNKKNKKKEKMPYIQDNIFDNWQKELSKYIHNGNNIILDIATSCGKSWSVRKIVCEMILPFEYTAIFIAPNIELVSECYEDIFKSYRKTYRFNSSKMVGMEVNNKYLNERKTLSGCQIICTTADNLSNLLCDKNLDEFVKNLKFIVYDEVHIPCVFDSFNFSSFSKLDIQFILLSATIDNSNDILKYMLNKFKNTTKLIKYNIRPIPIQYCLLKKDSKLNKSGIVVEKKMLQSNISLCLNINDPTIRDTKKLHQILGLKEKIPKSRIDQFNYSKNLLNDMSENTKQKIYNEELEKIDNSESIYSCDKLLVLLQSLISNDMGPIIIFNQSYTECLDLSKKLTSYIQNIESQDNDIKKAQKMLNSLEKLEKKKTNKYSSLEEQINKEFKNMKDDSKNEEMPLEEKYRLFIKTHLNKWRFSNNSPLKSIKYEWINELFTYGIGVHFKGISSRIRNIMFNNFRDKKIKVLIADNTLAVGVNLPVRSVIISGNIDKDMFKHMSGRAGRRGHDEQGYVIPLICKKKLKEIYLDKESSNVIKLSRKHNMLNLLNLVLNDQSYLTKKIYSNLKDENIDKTIHWLYTHQVIKSKLINICNVNNNHQLFTFLILLKNGFIHKFLSDKKDNKTTLLLLNLFIQRVEPQEEIISIQDDSFNTFIGEFNKTTPIDFQIKNKLDPYLFNFMSKNICKYKDKIGMFQRTVFNLINILEKINDSDLFVKKLKDLDKILWINCQKYNIKV